MKYTKDQRLDIGRRIYEGEISRFEAATEYGIGSNTAHEYMRLYRAEHHFDHTAQQHARHLTGRALHHVAVHYLADRTAADLQAVYPV